MTHPITRGPRDRFAVATPEVRRAAVSMAQAARAVARIHPHDDLDAVTQALPGSRSAEAAAALAAVWEESFANWTKATSAHARALRDGADDYDTAEDQVVVALDDRVPQWPVPRHHQQIGAW
ncbi:MAG: hypothetical protein L0H93_09110 [Nocardioides sp.]|nr:hypothetical protein [Nocardioides sp.]